MRRLRRSLHSRRDYQHVIELAYGRKGPFKHLLREAEIEASQPPKLARPPRFMLEPLPGASGETFTLAFTYIKMRLKSSNGKGTNRFFLTSARNASGRMKHLTKYRTQPMFSKSEDSGMIYKSVVELEKAKR